MAEERRPRAETQVVFKHVFTHANPGHIEDYFDLDPSLLGEGSFGAVHQGKDKATGVMRAIKTMNNAQIPDNAKFDLEVGIQQQLDHPNIVKLFEVFKDAQKTYLVLELCTGGELFDRIVEEAQNQRHGAFGEAAAAEYMAQILGSMNYLHERNFVHRDIKPENFLLQDKQADAPLKVIDFGLAASCPPRLKSRSGTPFYVAPQVMTGDYDEKCDIWSCGVMMYVLLCGYPPFNGRDDPEIFRKVRLGKFTFPRAEWGSVSLDAKDLITQMLTMDPEIRPNAASCLAHKWILAKLDSRADGEVLKDLGARLRSFKAAGNFKKVALTLVAQQLQDADIEQLKETFNTLDTDHDGRLTFAEITEGMRAHNIDLPDDLQTIIRSIDSDRSGQIDFSEFIAATLYRQQYLKREVMWAAFRGFDLDGDGSITRAELKQVVGSSMTDAAAANLIAEGDVNGDGVVNFEEFCAMMQTGGMDGIVSPSKRALRKPSPATGCSDCCSIS